MSDSLPGVFPGVIGQSRKLPFWIVPAPVSYTHLNILFFAEDQGLVEKLFATACDFVARVPIRRLTFYPDAKVWDQVRAFQGEPSHV